ncbi:MAG: penicillin binding protein PBP4B, partial [Blautia sp.]|nr:penicillin binding protein PBP4B [Blautia sp.]
MIKRRHRLFAAILCLVLVFTGSMSAGAQNRAEESQRMSIERTDSLPEAGWQGQPVFPDWKGYTDDTLAMNSMYTFFGYHGQGTLYIQPDKSVEHFSLYLNSRKLDTGEMQGGGIYKADISAFTKDGGNTLQISNIEPYQGGGKVTVSVPYPEILPGTLQEAGIAPEAVQLLETIISQDIENGFPSAQLAIIRNGRMVYENAWGKTNSYLPDGQKNPDSPEVTTETLYDLASVTKMFSVNYALQKLLTDGKVDLDARITDYLGDRFVSDTEIFPGTEETFGDPETIRSWKAELTIRDLLRHQGGFEPDPRYASPYIYKADLAEGEEMPVNPYFAGNGADEATRQATIEAICRTPLVYEPGTQTRYSDLDYMVLGLIIEKITGEDLDTWLKQNFFEPMGLTRITYNPLKNGFSKEDCAATELNGNTRDGIVSYPGYRTETLQGEVHDEKAWYSMMGISGHAGLFANAGDLARLASVMLCGGYGENRFFSGNVLEQFTAPKKEDAGNWGLGWWRQGDGQRVWYFGTQAASDTIGHQGWTGTLAMIDPERRLVVVYLTNKINSPVTDRTNADRFDGNWYTAGTLGFVPQILSEGLDEEADNTEQLLSLAADMAAESLKLVPEGTALLGDHPAAKNVKSKLEVIRKLSEEWGLEDREEELMKPLWEAYEKVRSDHKKNFNEVLLQVLLETEDDPAFHEYAAEPEKPVQEAAAEAEKPVQKAAVEAEKPVQEAVVEAEKPVQETVLEAKKPEQLAM